MFPGHCLAILLALVAATPLCVQAIPRELYSADVPKKVLATAQKLPSPIKYPQYTTIGGANGNWQLFDPDTWTSGFFPATLYALNERKKVCPTTESNGLGIADWVNLGRQSSAGLVALEDKTGVGHDVGFLSFPFADELEINPSNQTAKTGVNKFAAALAKRFSPVVGATRSWDDANVFKVIIDNMMNLEVLFLSADLTNNQTLRDIAITHARTTQKNHIREDGGTWHVIEYNSNTGAVVDKVTSQGYADSSTWTRGQAWGINGFVNMYQRTGEEEFLETALKLANYFLDRLPSDGIVPWDFDAPTTPAPRPADSSAATLAAYGFLQLADVVPYESEKWQNAAIDLLEKIVGLAWKPSWQSLLSNGTVNWPAGNKLTGTVYGDYYFILAGTELVKQGLAEC